MSDMLTEQEVREVLVDLVRFASYQRQVNRYPDSQRVYALVPVVVVDRISEEQRRLLESGAADANIKLVWAG